MNTVFIYRPRSSDRVFAYKESSWIRVTTWHHNGCRHVEGGIHFQWFSAHPRDGYWRWMGRQMLSQIVEEVGGIAWDEQGQLHVIIPPLYAWEVYRLIGNLAYQGQNPEIQENERELIHAGMARLVWNTEKDRFVLGGIFLTFDPPQWDTIPRPTYSGYDRYVEEKKSTSLDFFTCLEPFDTPQ